MPTWDRRHEASQSHEPCPTCVGIGCGDCYGTGSTRGKLPGTWNVRVDGHLSRSPEPYMLPDQICGRCFHTDFPRELANTYCYDAEWVILGHDDYTGTKNPDDELGHWSEGKWIRNIAPATPPRILWARGMWGIQIRLYKDANA